MDDLEFIEQAHRFVSSRKNTSDKYDICMDMYIMWVEMGKPENPYFANYYIDVVGKRNRYSRVKKKSNRKEICLGGEIDKLRCAVQSDSELDTDITSTLIRKISLYKRRITLLEKSLEEQAVIICNSQNPASLKLEHVEREHILKVFEACNRNKTRTAKMLGITLRTVRTKLKNYLG